MLAEIATQPDRFWQGTDDAADDRIARIRERHDLLEEVRALKTERDALREGRASRAQRSHNMPPELVDAPDEVAREIVVVWDRPEEAEAELEKLEPDPGRLAAIAQAILAGCRAVLAYCGKVADAAVVEAALGVGAAGGVWVVDHVLLSGRMTDFAQRLLAYAGG